MKSVSKLATIAVVALLLLTLTSSARQAGTQTGAQATPDQTGRQALTKDASRGSTPAASNAAVLEAWSKYSLEETGVSVDLPGEPQSFTVPTSRDMPQGTVLKGLFYSGNGLALFATYGLTPYSGGAYDFVTAMMDGLMKQQGLTNAKLHADRNTRAQRIPLKIVGKVNGVSTEFRGTLVYINDSEEVLMVMAEFAQSDVKARAAAIRALESIQISQQ
jgi:hypothetical protein